MYNLVLALHLTGAGLTGVMALYVAYVLTRAHSDLYRPSALLLGVLAALEVCTGTILSILSVRLSAGVVCERVFLYLAVVSVLEGVLFVRMSKRSMRFPLQAVVSPIIASLMLLGTALVYGF